MKKLFWKIFGPRYWITEEDVLDSLAEHGPTLRSDIVRGILRKHALLTIADFHRWQLYSVLDKGADKGLWLRHDVRNSYTGRVSQEYGHGNK